MRISLVRCVEVQGDFVRRRNHVEVLGERMSKRWRTAALSTAKAGKGAKWGGWRGRNDLGNSVLCIKEM